MASAKTVLVVVDDEHHMTIFTNVLDAHGYSVLQTKDAMEVLDMARKHRPDLILIDVQQSEVSGLEVVKRLKADELLRSILVAVSAEKGDIEALRESGCEAYFSKPIAVTSFMQMVSRLLS